MIGWLLDAVPLWIWLGLAGVALLAAWRLLGLRGLIAAAAALAGLLAYRAGRRAGGQVERDKRQREQMKAQQERLAMRLEGDRAKADAQAMTDEEARKEALRWSRRR